jgi:hypothetical protein
LLDGHEHPTRPDNHFVIDPTKWDFYAMDCYRLGGDNTRAVEHAQEILRLSQRPHGSDRSPMRATEARLTLSIVSLRDGDIDRATDWACDGIPAYAPLCPTAGTPHPPSTSGDLGSCPSRARSPGDSGVTTDNNGQNLTDRAPEHFPAHTA